MNNMKVVKSSVWIWVAAWTIVLMYFTLMIRTYQHGSTPIHGYPLVVGYLAGLCIPILLPFFIAYRPAKSTIVRYAGLCILVASLSFIFSETYAGVEEYIFERECSTLPKEGDSIFKSRWWPFEHHYLGYHPETESFFGGD